MKEYRAEIIVLIIIACSCVLFWNLPRPQRQPDSAALPVSCQPGDLFYSVRTGLMVCSAGNTWTKER